MSVSQRQTGSSVVTELSKELTETVIPISALVGLLLGGVVMFEAMTLSKDDVVISATVLSHSVLGPFACGLVGLILAARISAAQAAEIQSLYGASASDEQLALGARTVMLGAGAFASYIVFITCALVGSVIATEAALAGASAQIPDLIMYVRHPLEWIWDAVAATVMGMGISYAAQKSASRGVKHHKEISRTAGRSVSVALIAVCIVQTLYWLLLSLG